MKRVRVILGWLLAGAVVNVAAAWAIALTIHNWKPNEAIQMRVSPTETWAVVKSEAFGSEQYLSSRNKGTFYSGRHLGLRDPPFPRLGSHWGDVESSSASYRELRDAHEYRIIQGRGWPLRSMWGEDTFFKKVRGQQAVETIHGMTDTPFPHWKFPGFRQPIPVLPIWRGVIANTFFYAFMLWLPFAIGCSLRRLIRRWSGFCPHCAYDLRGTDHAACPECGTDVSKGRPS